MIFGSPGFADNDAPDVVLAAWNKKIADQVGGRRPSPFLELDPNDIQNGELSAAVKWPGHPLEPADCLGEAMAEKLSDWGWLGRAELHNEYLEYTIVMRPDSQGELRPKRFVATTELMEWWETMAVQDLSYFLKKVNDITGVAYSSQDLFGVNEVEWSNFSETARKRLFKFRLVGHGRSRPPLHGLNREHTLFMAHRINGLDDLIYVVHFGSFAYAVTDNGNRRRARLEEIFIKEQVEYLYCRNADPGAAAGAYSQVYLDQPGTPKAKTIAFGNPLGMYMRTFTSNDLKRNGHDIPESWVRWSRGDTRDTAQRLEFGPADDEEGFLDEVTIGSAPDASIINGYQLAKRIEVGPLVMISRDAREIQQTEFVDVPSVPVDSITCGAPSGDRCREIDDLLRLYQAEASMVLGTRGRPSGA